VTVGSRPAATRSNLLRLRRSLGQVERGAMLLRRRRQSLVEALFDLVRPALASRREVEEKAQAAYRALLEALAVDGSDALRAAGWPTREVNLELVPRDVAGIRGVELESNVRLVRSVAARGLAMGTGDASLAAAAEQFERLLELLLDVAPEEDLVRKLGRALNHVGRLVNTLEQRVAPSLERDVATMRQVLDEREREEHLRLRRRMRR
jgi:V/A-type H+-transporting ATPase subunit D